MKTIRRPLGAMETAQVITGQNFSFNVAAILRISNGPLPEQLKAAADQLLKRHPLLGASVKIERKSFYFQLDQPKEMKMKMVEREDENSWKKIAQKRLNNPIDCSVAPLVRLDYIIGPDNVGESEIIFTFHHVVMDAASGGNLVDELLSLCVKEALPPLEINKETKGLAPSAQDLFPPSYQGIRRKFNTFIYMMRMMADELSYKIQTMRSRKAPIHSSGQGKIIPMIFSKEMTTLLWKKARKTRITIKSLFDASLLMAVHKHLYHNAAMPLRYFVFPDLRPFLKPPLPAQVTGSYFATMRFTTSLKPSVNLTDLARNIQEQVYKSLKRGDKFSAHLQTHLMIKALMRFRSFRMGNTAVSYIGQVNVKPSYGNIKINQIHVYSSNFVLGPEYTAQTRLFNHQFYWDILYLDSDMDEEKAKQIADEIKHILETFALEKTQ